jgi:RHS repeat-associated protein
MKPSRPLLITALLSATTFAQTSYLDGNTPRAIQPGAPTGSFTLSDFEHINPYNGSLSVRVPLLTVGGRGSARVALGALVSQPSWVVDQMLVGRFCGYGSPCFTWLSTPTKDWWNSGGPGTFIPGYGPGVLQGKRTGREIYQCPNGGPEIYTQTFTHLVFTAPDGTEFQLYDTLGDGIYTVNCTSPEYYNRGRIFATKDASGATFVSDSDIYDYYNSDLYSLAHDIMYPTGNLMLKDGTKYRIVNGLVQWMRDRNGNKLTFIYDAAYYGKLLEVTDSLNRKVTITYGNPDVITYKGYGGTTRTIKIHWSALSTALQSGYTVQTYAQLFPNFGGGSGSYFNPSVVSSVELPDSRRQYFYYNPYGEVTKAVLPTGGAIEYEYGAGIRDGYASGQIGLDTYQIFYGDPPPTQPNIKIYRRLLERRVYPNEVTLEGKTTYSRPERQTSASYSGVIFASDGQVEEDRLAPDATLKSRQRHYFHSGSYGGAAEKLYYHNVLESYPDQAEGREYKTELMDGAVVKRRVENTWAGAVVTETKITLLDTNQVTKTAFGYDSYDNLMDVYEYDYGSGAPPTHASRRKHTDYVTTYNGANYANDNNIHLRNLPLREIVYSVNPGTGAQTWAAQTEYECDKYDGSSNHAPLLNRPNITGLDAAFTTSYTTRGNVTQVNRWLNSGGSSVVSTYAQYDIAGSIVKAIDARSYATEFDFTDRFGSPDGEARSNSGASELAGQTTYAFPTKVTDALGHEAYTQYDYYLGRPVDSEDPNSVKSSIYYEDALDRPTRGIAGLHATDTSARRQTRIVYDDANRVITTFSDKDGYQESSSNLGLQSKVFYDKLGRTYRAASYEGSTWAISATEFDALGRVKRTTNPFRALTPDAALPDSPEWITTTYDALSRVVEVKTPDNATVTTSYLGNAVTVTDQAGKQRKSVTNSLGQLTEIHEAPAGVNHLTSYTYDALNNLVRVEQGTEQKRYFSYDSLSRLVRVHNVEQIVNASLPAHTDPVTNHAQWTAAYSYDAAGNLLTRTDANNITASYTYDVLGRNTQVTYSGYPSGTASVQRFYDNPDASKLGKGRLWYTVSYNIKWEQPTDNLAYHRLIVESYDPLGRPTSQTQGMLYKNPAISNWDWADYRVQRTYDRAGNVLTQTYPSNRTVTYGYNAAGQLYSFTGTLGDGVARSYATGILYNAAGLLTKEAFGTQAQTLYRRTLYNTRLQAYNITLGTGTSDDVAHANSPTVNAVWDRGRLVNYYGSGDFTAWGTSGTNNNGNVLRADHWVPTTGSNHDVHYWDYSYDTLNRLTLMVEQRTGSHGSGEQFRQGYSYDRWGNRAIDLANTTAGVPGVTRDLIVFNTATNRITSITNTVTVTPTYDANGNQTSDGWYARWFDAENRLTKANVAGGAGYYYYDAQGKRARRVVGGQETWQVYGMDGYAYAGLGQPAPTAAQKEYGYRSGQLLIVAQTSPLEVRWLVSDHLGTPRINVRGTGADGGTQASLTRHDYLAFGEEIWSVNGGRDNPALQERYEPPPDGIGQKFAGKEKDAETGLAFFRARYYSATQGRFTSIDPENAGSIIFDPQSWNAYTYARNNSVTFGDPTGKKYKLCVNEDCSEHSDENVDKWRKDEKVIFKDGRIFNRDGQQIGTYERTWFDNETRQFNELIFGSGRQPGMVHYAPALKHFVEIGGAVALAIPTGIIGGGYLAGSGLTSLGLTQFGGNFAIIGSRLTTFMYSTLPGAGVLNIANWNPDQNARWIQQIITQRVAVYVASPLTRQFLINAEGKATQFAIEVQQLLAAGYTRLGNWLVPPK